MLRVVCFLTLASAAAVAFRPASPAFDGRPYPVNSTVARFFLPEWEDGSDGFEPAVSEADSIVSPGILLFRYSAYDSVYTDKMQRLVQRKFPACDIGSFDEGTPEALALALKDRSAVIVAYPSVGNPAQLKAFGTVLKRFAQQGGVVAVTGTHEYAVLQQLGLFDLDYGYFCADPSVHTIAPGGTPSFQQTLMAGLPNQFSLTDYAYPLDISDPAFVTVADVRGYPVAGYKSYGRGKIVYLGWEYYHDELEPTTMLVNVLRSANSAYNNRFQTKVIRRQQEFIVTGSGSKDPQFTLAVYPNPYMEKATLDLDLEKTAPVYVEMTDQTGRSVALLLPRKTLSPGLYRFELPNLPAGVYFVQCEAGNKKTVKRVVKTQAQ